MVTVTDALSLSHVFTVWVTYHVVFPGVVSVGGTGVAASESPLKYHFSFELAALSTSAFRARAAPCWQYHMSFVTGGAGFLMMISTSRALSLTQPAGDGVVSVT